MTHEPGSGDADIGFLVPVSDSPSLDATVEYAAREAREVAAEIDGDVALFLVTPVTRRGPPDAAGRTDATGSLESATDVVEASLGEADPEGPVAVETAVLELDRYPVDPFEYVDAIVEFASERGVDTIVVDPDHRMPAEAPIRRSLENELRSVGVFDVEVAPVDRPARSSRLVTRGGAAQFLTLALVSYGFYLVVGGLHEPVFDLVTGAATALLVAGVLSRITFERTPRPTRIAASVGRWCLYVPYLLWKITTANLQIAYVVLHPSLPIDPTIERFEPGVWGGTATATLANSITLTPGTLTVDVRDGEFVVHALTDAAHEDLLEGSLERAVRFVFYGRSGFRYPSPRERLGYDGNDEEVATDGGAVDAETVAADGRSDDPATSGGDRA